ncbi:exported hypothetical protein [Tenacibaculum litopenaei]|uniref:hypothetical protein n=1 Tax=Tenacibaculum litopenaei TaxID=396016 RepID=UPI00389472FE
MKRYLGLLVLLFTIGCNDIAVTSFEGDDFGSYKMTVSSDDGNAKGKVRTAFAESGNFKFDDTVAGIRLPYSKTYTAAINVTATAFTSYTDETVGTFAPYTVKLQIFRSNILEGEKLVLVGHRGAEVSFDLSMNK